MVVPKKIVSAACGKHEYTRTFAQIKEKENTAHYATHDSTHYTSSWASLTSFASNLFPYSTKTALKKTKPPPLLGAASYLKSYRILI
jgi:hypothetical protein